MNYFDFLTREIIKDKLTYLLIFIFMSSILFTLFENIHIEPSQSIQQNLKDDIKTREKDADSKNEKQTIKEDKKALQVSKKNNLNLFYSILEKQNKKDIAVDNNALKARVPLGKQEIQAPVKENLRYQFLKSHNFKYESEPFPVHGTTFTTDSFRDIIPLIFSIISIFLLVQFFSKLLFNKIDKNSLLPGSFESNIFTQVGTALLSVIVLLTLVTGLTFIISSISAGTGSFNYPIFGYDQSGAMIYSPVWVVFIKSFTLSILSLSSIVSIIIFIVSLFRNKMTSLLISILLIVGTEILTTIIKPMQQVAHLLPMTYLYSLTAVTGETRVGYENGVVSFNNGTIVTLVSFVVFLYLTLVIRKKDIYL